MGALKGCLSVNAVEFVEISEVETFLVVQQVGQVRASNRVEPGMARTAECVETEGRAREARCRSARLVSSRGAALEQVLHAT